jgi:hypothetical protein
VAVRKGGRDLKVGLLWRLEWDRPGREQVDLERCRLHGMFAAFASLGVKAEPVVYDDDRVERVREQLLPLDGVLVWVNPLEQGRDRSTLDPLLRTVAAEGVFVSAHPDVILRMGTKQVLIDTREMGWGTDSRLYRSFDELWSKLPARLVELGPLVLKRHRGMGGNGVWKVEAEGQGLVVAQHALGAASPERMTIEEFLGVCEPYFADGGPMIDQPYQARLPEGMIRAYLVHDRVVGFAHQYPRGLMPSGVDKRPTSKLFEPASTPSYEALRERLESAWICEMQSILDLDTRALPVIWDADFLYGPKDAAGEETFVLCEINASSTFAFPEFAMPTVAAAALERIRAGRARS